MIKPVPSCAALLLALCATWSQAQVPNVYRCGESYSNQPCAGATMVPTDDARSPAQRAQTDAATKRDARSAQIMEAERLRLEGKPAQAVIPPAPAPVVTPAKDKPSAKGKLKKPELFTAVSPRKPGDAPDKKARKKAPKDANA